MVERYAKDCYPILRVSLLLQIKNTLHLAANMAAAEQEDLSSSYISDAFSANGKLVPNFIDDSATDLYES